MTLKIGKRLIGDSYPTYFIAEIGANHDGRLQRAKDLCYMAKEAGSDCAKVQHYRADTLASKSGFSGVALSHYEANPHTVFSRYETPWEWTPALKEYCDSISIEFMSTPYDEQSADMLDGYVNAFKIGSGDITYTKFIEYVARKNKPIIISTGASDEVDVDIAVAAAMMANTSVAILQCSTNYTGLPANIGHTNLNVIETYRHRYSTPVIGLSDHNISTTIVTGAVALGARIIERHFTDDRTRSGPDHPFAMEPAMWKGMVREVRLLESALGSHQKFVTIIEKETIVLQRRCIRAAHNMKAGDIIQLSDMAFLRPAPVDSYKPYQVELLVGRTLKEDINVGDYFRRTGIL